MVNITKNFIKQCEHAGEIQSVWDINKKPMYDWIYFYSEKSKKNIVRICTGLHGRLLYFVEHGSGYSSYMETIFIDFKKSVTKQLKEYIWLPTQGQLQEILCNFYQGNSNIKGLNWGDSINEHMLNRLLNFEKDNRNLVYDLNSLWLAFVMYEKYNKIWTGKKWVLINEKNNL